MYRRISAESEGDQPQLKESIGDHDSPYRAPLLTLKFVVYFVNSR